MNLKKNLGSLRVATRTSVSVIALMAVMLLAQVAFAADHVTDSKPATHSVPGSTSSNGAMKVNVPFDFVIEGKSLEAGEYYLTPLGENWISIKDASGATAILALTHATSLGPNTTEPKLVFHRYGNKYFLAQTWLRYSSDGREFFTSNDERKIAREVREGTALEAGR